MKPTIASLALNGLLLASLGTVSAPAKVTAQDAAQGAPADTPPAEKVVDNRPEIKSSITEHTITIAGQSAGAKPAAVRQGVLQNVVERDLPESTGSGGFQ